MSTAVADKVWTTAELLALPDDGVQRWLIRGELREKPGITRDRAYRQTLVHIAQSLHNWGRGQVLAGQVCCRLRRDPETIIGTDIVCLDPEAVVLEINETRIVDDTPLLCVEIPAPNLRLGDLDEKVIECRAAGVIVWVVNPRFRTLMVYRPDAEPESFNVNDELTAEPHLPGFRVPMRQLFEN